MQSRPMRVAIVTESFLPQVNGVTGSVVRTVEHLVSRGHEVLVVAPGAGPIEHGATRVVRMPALALPGYPTFALGWPSPQLGATLADFAPDVVHLASPIVLGAQGAVSAWRAGIPTVAVYQTDVVRFAARYGFSFARRGLWSWLRHVHRRCARNLAPSTRAAWDLRRNGINRVHIWARGVDSTIFTPALRSAELRARLAPRREVLVGYVGRLAPEKRVELLAPLARRAGCRLVIVGDGPSRATLERRLEGATFFGLLHGRALGEAVASLDVFVHPGTDETFCQAAQEALRAGVPVVAPAAGGLVDLVRPGSTGLLSDPARPHDLIAAVLSLVADADTRRAMGARASASVAGRSWQAIGDQLVGHYRAVLGVIEQKEVA